MLKSTGKFLLGIFIFLLCTGYYFISSPQGSKTHNVTVQKIGKQWKVVLDTTSEGKKNKLIVKGNETIVWTVKGSDAYFQFAIDTIFVPESPEDNLEDGFTKYVKNGNKLKLKVKKGTQPMTMVYAIFCIQDKQFATQDSPPKIIIQ